MLATTVPLPKENTSMVRGPYMKKPPHTCAAPGWPNVSSPFSGRKEKKEPVGMLATMFCTPLSTSTASATGAPPRPSSTCPRSRAMRATGASASADMNSSPAFSSNFSGRSLRATPATCGSIGPRATMRETSRAAAASFSSVSATACRAASPLAACSSQPSSVLKSLMPTLTSVCANHLPSATLHGSREHPRRHCFVVAVAASNLAPALAAAIILRQYPPRANGTFCPAGRRFSIRQAAAGPVRAAPAKRNLHEHSQKVNLNYLACAFRKTEYESPVMNHSRTEPLPCPWP